MSDAADHRNDVRPADAGPVDGAGWAGGADTVTGALNQLVSEGYRADFSLVHGVLRRSGAPVACPVADAVVERMHRFEGESDPGDEMVVFGIYDPIADVRGTLVSGFGLAADPEVWAHLSYLAGKIDAS